MALVIEYGHAPPLKTRTPKGFRLSGLPLVMFVGRLELDLGIQAGGVALIAGAGGQGVVGPD